MQFGVGHKKLVLGAALKEAARALAGLEQLETMKAKLVGSTEEIDFAVGEGSRAWQRAVEFDRKIRVGIHKVRAKCYVHRDCQPLDKVDLSTDSERGQGLLWGNECEGMCGV